MLNITIDEYWAFERLPYPLNNTALKKLWTLLCLESALTLDKNDSPASVINT